MPISTDEFDALEKIMGMIDEKNITEIINIVDMALGVTIYTNEASFDKERLKKIIEERILRLCPRCRGGNVELENIFKPCGLCGGQGMVNGITEKKYLEITIKG